VTHPAQDQRRDRQQGERDGVLEAEERAELEEPAQPVEESEQRRRSEAGEQDGDGERGEAAQPEANRGGAVQQVLP
jgi:hypothetical protein